MLTNCILSYAAAKSKSLEIVNRDAEIVKFEEFPLRKQVDKLISYYTRFDPDTLDEKLCLKENNFLVLKKDVKFMLTAMIEQNFSKNSRFNEIFSKYDFKRVMDLMNLNTSFAEEWYEIVKEHPQTTFSLPEKITHYKNFKTEHDMSGMMTLLPSGTNYGGFVKAFLHRKLSNKPAYGKSNFNKEIIQDVISENRIFYNTKKVSNKTRLEFFSKLNIKENDCILWSQIFDQNFPNYKNVHKFFGQIA